MADPSWNEQHAQALLALTHWLGEARLTACVCHATVEVNLHGVVERLGSLPLVAEFQQIRIPMGPRHGANFARDFILRLADAFWPDEGPFTEEPTHLRRRVLNFAYNWRHDHERPLLLLVSDLDFSLDAWVAGDHWWFGEVGEGVRAFFSLTGQREAATEWGERLSLPKGAVAYVAVVGEPGTSAARRALSAPESYSSALLTALGALSASLEPMSVADLAQIVGIDERALGHALDAEAETLQQILELERRPLRFRDHTQQKAWAVWEEPSVRAGSKHLDDAAMARFSSPSAPFVASTYLRKNAVKHLFVRAAPTAILMRACEPEWAWPSSLLDLVDRRSDLDHVRLLCAERASEEHSALVGLTGIALAQAALSSLLAADWLGSGTATNGPAEQASLFAARCALARQASQTVGIKLLARAREQASLGYRAWSAGRELISLAELSEGELSVSISRLAVAALRSSDGGLRSSLTLRAARLLPASDSAALFAEVVVLIRSALKPSQIVSDLLRPGSRTESVTLDSAELEGLFQVALTLPRGAAANALAVLFDRLDGVARDEALAFIWRTLLDDQDEDAACHEPSGSESFDAPLCLEAVASSLTEQQTLDLVDNPRWSGMGTALARRLAELGHTNRVPDVIASLCGEGLYAAHAWLSASAAASDGTLDAATLAVLGGLDDDQRAELVVGFPAAILRLVGLIRAVEITRAAPNSSGYARVAALAGLCLAADPTARPGLAEATAQAYFDAWDTEALDLVVDVSRWLSPGTALRLYVSTVGVVADAGGISVALQGWGGVEQLAPLLARIAFDPLLEATSEMLELLERWSNCEERRAAAVTA